MESENHTCYTCNVSKPKQEFFKDSQSPNLVKNHCKDCMYQKKEEFKKKIKIPDKLKCKVCAEEKDPDNFDIDNTIYIGRKRTCKICLSKYNKEKSQTWDFVVRKKVVYSWKAHNNTEMINKIEIHEAMKLLKQQDYRCAHCKHQLSQETGDLYKKNYWCASLDRINVSVIGYSNNNAQWLCMSCNNGKNTMPNEEHLVKFKIRDDRINELLEENKKLRAIIQSLKITSAEP